MRSDLLDIYDNITGIEVELEKAALMAEELNQEYFSRDADTVNRNILKRDYPSNQIKSFIILDYMDKLKALIEEAKSLIERMDKEGGDEA